MLVRLHQVRVECFRARLHRAPVLETLALRDCRVSARVARELGALYGRRWVGEVPTLGKHDGTAVDAQ
jgi:hypothetical protein